MQERDSIGGREMIGERAGEGWGREREGERLVSAWDSNSDSVPKKRGILGEYSRLQDAKDFSLKSLQSEHFW